jgi:sterol desaturase/sphingolipid hydroxylase (fatty acid hydroxylase superfamily)
MRYLLLVAGLLIVLERFFPAHPQKSSWRWVLVALLISFAGLPTLMVGQQTWIPFFREHRLHEVMQGAHPLLAGFVAFLTFQFFLYWWHRAKHESNALWRMGHQIHHSPRRIEVLTAYYGHPVDGLTNLVLSAFVCWFLLGLDFAGVAAFAFIEGVYDYFTHSNLRTPYWLGWFIQRPEMHRVHHERGVHGSNYALPIWDMLFGTHVNPRRHEEVALCGFEHDKETRLLDMLLFRDVHRMPATQPAADPGLPADPATEARRGA